MKDDAPPRAQSETAPPPAPGRRRLSRWLLPLLLLGIGIGIAGWLHASKESVPAQAVAERVWPVAAVAVELRDIRPALSAYGTVVAARAADIRPLVGGQLVDVSEDFVSGGRVDQGEELFRIAPFDYEIARATIDAQIAESEARRQEIRQDIASERALLEQDREELAIAARDVARREELFGRGFTSERALDEARLSAVNARAAITTREQAINRLQSRLAQEQAVAERLAVSRRQAERDLEDTVFHAPFAGIIEDPNIAIGKQVSTSDLLGRLIDTAALEALFQLRDADYARLVSARAGDEDGLIGQSVTVNWRLGERVLQFPATLVRQEANIEAASGGISLFARIAAQDGRQPLRPGAFVEVELPDRLYENVAVLPQRAVGLDGSLYVIGPDERLARIPVEVLRRADGEAIIRGNALEEGMRIVTSRFPEISAGLKVSVTGPDAGPAME